MVSISVCVGSACHVKGSYNVINTFQQLIKEYNVADKIELKAAFCLGHCAGGVSVVINEDNIYSLSEATARSFFQSEVMSKI